MKPKYMLDTNICIYLMKHQQPQVQARFAECFVGDVVISASRLPSWSLVWPVPVRQQHRINRC